MDKKRKLRGSAVHNKSLTSSASSLLSTCILLFVKGLCNSMTFYNLLVRPNQEGDSNKSNKIGVLKV